MGENGDKKGMTVKDYEKTEAYMLSCMNDSAHDKEHVYRVLYYALEIAKQEPDVDYEILITSCLLHDIGRKEQFENPGFAMHGSAAIKRMLFWWVPAGHRNGRCG